MDSVSLLVIIVNYRSALLCEGCLDSLSPEIAALSGAKVLVIDGASPDDSAVRLKQFIEERGYGAWCRLEVLDHNGGYSFANNHGLRSSLESVTGARLLMLLNPDTIVRPGAIRSMVEMMMQRPDVSICGARLENPDGTSQLAARRFPTPLGELEAAAKFGPITKLLGSWRICPEEPSKPVMCGWTPGAALLFRRDALEKVGVFDESYFMYFEEVDLCLRAARAGIGCWYLPQARVIHLVGQSSGVTVASGRPKRLPGYWFASRRHYYLKNYGRFTLLWANAALVVGTLIHRVVSVLRRRSPSDPPALIRDLLFGRD